VAADILAFLWWSFPLDQLFTGLTYACSPAARVSYALAASSLLHSCWDAFVAHRFLLQSCSCISVWRAWEGLGEDFFLDGISASSGLFCVFCLLCLPTFTPPDYLTQSTAYLEEGVKR
jgi:hypothetical protein